MKINGIDTNQYKQQSFRAAYVSINALSDTHGELQLSNNALEEMRNRQKDIFYPDERGKLNIFSICGDWFIDGSRTGYSSNPQRKNAFYQLDFLNTFISQIKNLANNLVTLFVCGNHEFDGGVALCDEILSNIDAEVLITNLDLENTSGFEKSISTDKIVNERIVEVEDDKNPDLKHKILFLGVIPVNLVSYQRKTDDIKLLDNVLKSQKSVTREDYERTIEDCKQRIKEFKQENPNGIVILMSHTGVKFADNLAKESCVDLIFDGHEHKDNIRVVNDTAIVPLSQNFNKLVNAKILIDDDGKLQNINISSYSPLRNKNLGPLNELYETSFKYDIQKKYSLRTDNPNVKLLDLKNLRQGNNYLANFVTDSILEEIRKKDDTVDFFALNSSSIRHSLKISEEPGIGTFDIMNVLSGISEEDGEIMITELSGNDTVYFVLDNLLFNNKEPNQNTIVHYSGLIIDKTNMLKAYNAGECNPEKLIQYVVDERTQKPLDNNRIYKIANTEKYFNKSQTPKIRELKGISEYFGSTVQQMFRKHFAESNGILYAKCDERIK